MMFGASGCIGDKRPGVQNIESLKVTKDNKNQLCFYVDDFIGIDKYYIYSINTKGDAWTYSLPLKYLNDQRTRVADPAKATPIRLSSIAGNSNCVSYGTNMDGSKSNMAKNIDYNSTWWINIRAYKEPYISDKTDISFENFLHFKHNKDTKTPRQQQ
jgi:hypothetical protein